MNSVEIEQLKQDLELKVGVLRIKIHNGEIHESAIELIDLFVECEQNGTTLEELKLLYDDVLLALYKKE